MKISCSGKIVIARYGKVFRGNKVKNAQLAGAKAIILYSDPADYFVPGVQSYPDGWNLPGGGVQRGNVLNLNGAGDPLTPGYPANEYAYRHDITEAVGLPNIAVHPIGYYDAQKLLEKGDATDFSESEVGKDQNIWPVCPFSSLSTKHSYSLYSSIYEKVFYDLACKALIYIGDQADIWRR
ncbi:glutamate carboxypeptidase 2-like, partial [Marmota marmota marmota]|uniref:glutamate carboxypeptidase 2-like n=1 Tax=Marmota marmota marmota TaxID=9994 RepID=UPI002093C04A